MLCFVGQAFGIKNSTIHCLEKLEIFRLENKISTDYPDPVVLSKVYDLFYLCVFCFAISLIAYISEHFISKCKMKKSNKKLVKNRSKMLFVRVERNLRLSQRSTARRV